MRERLGQSHNGRFTRCIRQHPHARDIPGDTAHIHDGSARSKQPRQQGLGQKECMPEIDRDAGVPVFGRDV